MFFRLLSSIFVAHDNSNELVVVEDGGGDRSMTGTARASTNNKQSTMMHRQRAGVLNELFSFASSALSLPMQQLQPDRLAKIQSLAGKSQVVTCTTQHSHVFATCIHTIPPHPIGQPYDLWWLVGVGNQQAATPTQPHSTIPNPHPHLILPEQSINHRCLSEGLSANWPNEGPFASSAM